MLFSTWSKWSIRFCWWQSLWKCHLCSPFKHKGPEQAKKIPSRYYRKVCMCVYVWRTSSVCCWQHPFKTCKSVYRCSLTIQLANLFILINWSITIIWLKRCLTTTYQLPKKTDEMHYVVYMYHSIVRFDCQMLIYAFTTK